LKIERAIELSKSLEGRILLFDDYYRGWYLIPLERQLRDVMEQFKRGKGTTNKTIGE
jgi:hypothetical protein